jgi:PAS domain S-box-containing protein
VTDQPTRTSGDVAHRADRDDAAAPWTEDDTSITAAHARGRPKRDARARVLFADVDAETRDYVRRLLEAEYDVTCARDGAEALELVAVDPPDLVLADVSVPAVDGLGILAALRSDERTASIPVILLSALEGADARDERLLAEADDYVLKPFSARELLARVGGAIALARTRTEQHKAAKALAYNERRYRSLVEASTSVIWSTDNEGQMITENPSWSAFTGQTRDEYSGTGWSLAIHSEDRARTIDVWRRAVEARTFYQTEYRLRRHDGVYRHVVAKGVPVMSDEGALVEWIGTCTDIDDQKRIEEELKVANRRKDEFLAILAHELRNPLAPIRNGLEILRVAGDEREPVVEARVMMERQLAQMVRLVDELLDLSRISRGTIELHREACDLAAIVASAVETSRPLVDHMEHELAIRLPEETILVDADATRLAQVFANLLNNAAKYTERGGHVSLSVEASDDEVAVRVKDTGVGIPPEMLARVFDMFTQVDRSLERAQGGLGIGLSVAKQLVEMHGGRIEVSSEEGGKGSEFTVVVPRIARPVASESVPASDADARPEVRRRVLVADDNVDALTSLAMLLEIVGHEVRVAHDGLEAVELAREYRPDAVLLDIGMPRLNGYDACRRIRETAWGRDALVIALTGWGQERDKREARDAGFDYHLVKPVEPAILQQLLSGSCEVASQANLC